MTGERRLGVLGGTFDPIHHGHLRAGEAAERVLELGEIRIVPAHDPPHRSADPRASAFHRFALAALAIDGKAAWRLSDAELRRAGPSYTAHTLRALHAEGWQPSQIFFILGSDAFAEIETWYDFPAVLDDANFAIMARKGTPGTVARATADRLTARRADPAESAPKPTAFFFIDAATPEISSTLIRTRLAARLPIDDLVPPPVAHYIRNHGLYDSAAVDDLHGETQRTHR
jgi:nicotinate-nucleotide adenylyltransferase